MAAKHNSDCRQVEGLHLRVDRAAGSRSTGGGAAPVEYARARSVFVGNLHFDTLVRVVFSCNKDDHTRRVRPSYSEVRVTTIATW